MFYSIVSEDIEDSVQVRSQNRKAHIQRLKVLKDLGRLILAGPNPAIDTNEPGEAGFSGSIVIAEFDSLKSAESWAEEDPYLLGGVYKNSIVKPFKRVLP